MMVPTFYWLMIFAVAVLSVAFILKHATATPDFSYFFNAAPPPSLVNKKGKKHTKRLTQSVKHACAAFKGINPFADITQVKDAINNITAAIMCVSDSMGEAAFPHTHDVYFKDMEKTIIRGLLACELFKSWRDRSLLSVAANAKCSMQEIISYFEEKIDGNDVHAPHELTEFIRAEIGWLLPQDDHLRASLIKSTLHGVHVKLSQFNAYHSKYCI